MFYRNRFLDVKPSYYYAAFSAVLLRSIGSVDHSRRIEICDQQGVHMSFWQPQIGSMPEGSFYKVRLLENHYPHLSQLQSPIFAQAIMPDAGISWLAEDQNLYVMWLAYLNQYQEYAGSFGTDLDRIVSAKQHKVLQGIADDKAFKPKEMIEYELFLLWLKEQIRKKKIKINERGSSIHVVKKKWLWVNKSIVKKYIGDSKKRVPGGIVLAKFFNSMGIPCYGEMDFKYKSFFGPNKSSASGLFKHDDKKQLPKGGVLVSATGLLGKSGLKVGNSSHLHTKADAKNENKIQNKAKGK